MGSPSHCAAKLLVKLSSHRSLGIESGEEFVASLPLYAPIERSLVEASCHLGDHTEPG